jgi:hypothetical protein
MNDLVLGQIRIVMQYRFPYGTPGNIRHTEGDGGRHSQQQNG